MITIGVTGKYCAGKDTVVEILEQSGFVAIDVDALGHDALESEQERIVAEFGDRIRTTEGSIDRRALGAIVFADKRALAALEAIIHPQMVQATREQIAEIRRCPEGRSGEDGAARGAVINAAILFRMKLDRLCDTVIFVDAPLRLRVQRARRRDGSGLFSTLRRLASQADVDPQYSSSDADIHSVANDGSREGLEAKLRAISLSDGGSKGWSNTKYFLS